MRTRTTSSLQQALRLFTILHLVATRRSDARVGRAELAQACSCSDKTIGRDVEALRSVYFPLEYDSALRTYYFTDKNWSLSLKTMTDGDAIALGLLQGFLAGDAAAFPFLSQVQTTLDKAALGLSPALQMLRESVTTALREVHGSARDYSQAPIPTLARAAAQRETVEFLYVSRSGGTEKWRRADPLRLDKREGRYLELQAWCHENRVHRTFALDRIREVRLTGQRFEARLWDDSDEGVVGGLRGGPPVEIVVRFDAVVAAFARDRRWPFAAEFTDTDDSGLIMRGVVQGMDGIVRELLSWRRHAEVLGGPELRARMREEVEAMAALYAAPEKK